MSTRIKLSTYGFDKTIETSLRRSMSLTKVTCDHLQSQMLIFLSINDSSKDLFITFHDPYMFSHFCMSRNLYPFVVTFLLILDLTIICFSFAYAIFVYIMFQDVLLSKYSNVLYIAKEQTQDL